MIKEKTTGGEYSEESSVFIELERLFRRKGHTATQATQLAYEAMDILEEWYEEKLEGENG